MRGAVAVKTMEICGSSELEHFIGEAAFMITAAGLGGRGAIPLLRIVFTQGARQDTVQGHLVMGRGSGTLIAEVNRVVKQVRKCGESGVRFEGLNSKARAASFVNQGWFRIS